MTAKPTLYNNNKSLIQQQHGHHELLRVQLT